MRYSFGLGNTALRDVGAIKDIAQALDGAGFDYITTSGHTIGSEPGRHDRPLGTYVGPFYDPFVLFSYLASITTRLKFRTSILILPLYATPLIAKQAGELKLLSGDRFELGVAISWNGDEYASMGADIHTRGRRMEEQIDVLRKMWDEPYISYEGRFHHLDHVGLGWKAGDVPIWIGCSAEEKVLRRAARLADGWLPIGIDLRTVMPTLQGYLKDAGRDPSKFGTVGRLAASPEGPDAWIAEARELQAIGVTDLAIQVPGDLPVPQALPKAIEVKKAVAAALGH